MERDTFTAIRRSTENSVLYAIELLQSDYQRSEYHQIVLAPIYGLCFRNGTRRRVRDVITTARQTDDRALDRDPS